MSMEYLGNLRDKDFNPWWGCTKVSEACDHCYAENVTRMRGASVWGKDAPRKFMSYDHWMEPIKWNDVAKAEKRRWNIFCGSLCDVMEAREDLNPHREALFWLVERTPWLNWMFFTKRPDQYHIRLPKPWQKDPRENVWLVTTVEHQKYMWRLEACIKVPAVVHGVICEPLMSEITFPKPFMKLKGRAWIIAGCERGVGKHSRISDIGWLRKMRDDAARAKIPFFFNQWGEYGPVDGPGLVQVQLGHNHPSRRILDGREWNGVPQSVGLIKQLAAAGY